MSKAQQQEFNQISLHLTDEIPIPENINDLQVDNSTLAPLIFWALVALRRLGHQYATGINIARVINKYLVDDHNQKAPTNISRALRHKTLQSQEWLVTLPGPIYGLVSDWQGHWTQIFGTTAPKFENQ